MSDNRFKSIGCWCSFFAIALTVIILISVSLKKLTSTEIGLEYNVHSKQLDDAAKAGGLHAGPPGFRFVKFPSTFVTVDLPDGTCVSRDGLQVKFEVTFQYQLPQEWIVPVVVKYRDFYKWQDVVIAAGNSAVQHTCSEFNVSDFQNKRGVIQETMEDNLRLKLEGEDENGEDGVFARAISLQLRNVFLPSAYLTAVGEKQSAAEDIVLAKNQRTQEMTKAQTQLLTARSEARKINETAIIDAEVMLTEAKFKAEEALFAFQKEAQVLVNVKEKLNLTSAGILAYMAIRLYAEVPELKVSAAEPAKLSRKDEL